MGLSIGIVGLPNVGKSTLFNAITKAGAEAANYPFCTIEPNVGVVDVPDPRLNELARIFGSKRIVPTAVKFVDIAGIVRGASKGEGLGNKFLAHIREVDAIAHVVRCFEDSNVTHVEGGVDPLRDMETINLELIFADLDGVERRIEKNQRAAKGGDKDAILLMSALTKLKAVLDSGRLALATDLTDDERKVTKELSLLTFKPVLYIANVGEDEIATAESSPLVQKVMARAKEEHAEVVPISAKVESEIAELEDAEKAEFLGALGLTESGLDRVIRIGYRLLNLMSFLTAGEQEARAWTIRKGTKAPQAASEIHSDIERGFIRAEIVAYRDLLATGSMTAAKDKGLVRLEGKEYIMQDGDVVNFRFNV